MLFFIKKGVKMHLHDHPNMSVFFRLLFGGLDYKGYDKLDSKYKYNKFSNDEYAEIMETKKTIHAKITNKMHVTGP